MNYASVYNYLIIGYGQIEVLEQVSGYVAVGIERSLQCFHAPFAAPDWCAILRTYCFWSL